MSGRIKWSKELISEKLNYYYKSGIDIQPRNLRKVDSKLYNAIYNKKNFSSWEEAFKFSGILLEVVKHPGGIDGKLNTYRIENDCKIFEVVKRNGDIEEITTDVDFTPKTAITTDKDGYALMIHKGKAVRLHRYLLGVTDPKIQVDHISGNVKDNRKCNLRICTPAQNNGNRRHKGVTYRKNKGKWEAYIRIKGISKYLGLYEREEDAIKAYQTEHAKVHKEFSPYFN